MKTVICSSLLVLLSFSGCTIFNSGKSQDVAGPPFQFTDRFGSRDEITNTFTKMWTGIIDTAGYKTSTTDIFAVLHDRCSGVACPSFYVYVIDPADERWGLTFLKDYTNQDLQFSGLPGKISYAADTIKLFSREGELVESFGLDRLTVVDN